MRPHSILLILFFVFLFQGDVHPAEGKKLERVIVANAVVSENRVPLWIAKDMGIFEKYGLDVQIVFIRGAGLNVAALVGGDVHIAFAAGLPAIAAAARGAPIVLLATLGPTEYQLVSQPSISSIQQLKGKTIGVANFGAGDYFVLRRLLPKMGLAPDKDVKIIAVGATQSYEKLQILLTGRIDSTLSTAESVTRFQLEGNKFNVIADTTKEAVEVSGTDIFTTRQFLKNYPDRMKSFLKGFSEGISIGRDNKELVYQTVRKYMKVEDRKLLEVMVRYRYLLGPNPQKPYPLKNALDLDIADLSATSAPELKGKKASDYIDTTLLGELEREGFFASPKS
jgi:NitT/TauT family transport system substrate-binding protein